MKVQRDQKGKMCKGTDESTTKVSIATTQTSTNIQDESICGSRWSWMAVPSVRINPAASTQLGWATGIHVHLLQLRPRGAEESTPDTWPRYLRRIVHPIWTLNPSGLAIHPESHQAVEE